MPRVERQIIIQAPVETVFNYLADFSRHPEWARNRLRIEQTPGGTVAAGVTFRSAAGMWGGIRRDEVTVVEFVPNSKIAFEAVGAFGHHRQELVLDDQGGRTRLRKSQEPLGLPSHVPFALAVFGRLPPSLQKLVIGRILEGDLRRIKARVEVEAVK